jgi:hypothetical protein
MMGLSFTAAGRRQRNHSQVRVPRDSWPHFNVSNSRLAQPGRPGPHMYIPQEQGGPVIPPSTGIATRRVTVERKCLPACQSALQPWVSLGLLYNQSPPGVRFLRKIINDRMGLLAPCPTPILEDQGASFSLDTTLWRYRHGWPCW